MKTSNSKTKAFVFLGAAFVLLIALLFTGCPQSPENQTQNPSVPPAEQKVTLTVAKSEHVQKAEPASLTVAKGSAWSAVKGNITVTYEAGWEAAGWKFDSVAGSDISDATVFNENKTVVVLAKAQGAPASEKITITVTGGEHVTVHTANSFTADKGAAWQDIRSGAETLVTYDTGWQAAGWKIGNASGDDIIDAAVFSENKTVFVAAKPLVDQNLEIEGGVLKSCKQKPYGILVIPADVTEIAEDAFSSCFGLTQVHFPEGLKKIGKKAFKECPRLNQLSLPKSLETLDDEAFSECTKIEGKIVLPENLKTIGCRAFYECKKIGDFDFSGCTKLTEIKTGAFAWCTGLEQLILPESLETLGVSAFFACTGIKGTIILPKDLKIIGRYAFAECKQVKAFDFSQCTLLTEIGSQAFRLCENIGTFDFSQCTALKTIGDYAFSDCKNIQKVILPVNLTTIEAGTFYKCTALTDLTVAGEGAKLYAAGNVIYSGDKTQLLCSAPTVEEVKLPPELIEIAGKAFHSNSKLKRVDFSDCNLLESIGNLAFDGCKNLTGMLKLPATLKTIGEAAFRDCENLTSVDMSACSNLQKIDTSTFSGCKGLREVIFPASRMTIRTQAFLSCTQVYLFDFYRCTQLTLDGSNIFSFIPGRFRIKKNSGLKEVLSHFYGIIIQEDD